MKFAAPLLLAFSLVLSVQSTSELTEEQNQWRSIIEASQPKIEGPVPAVMQPCTPCVRNGRSLQLFPKLRERWQNATNRGATNDEVVEIMQSTAMADIFGNSTIGELFGTIASNPILLLGTITIVLAVLLPLIILEVLSNVTSTPVLCILGFANSILFGACRRRRRLGQAQVDGSFLRQYFPEGEARIPSNTAEAEAQIASVLEFGQSDPIFKYLNNATIASVVTEIANGEGTRPLLTTTLTALLPIVTLQRVSTHTDTPIACLLGQCRRLSNEKQNDIEDHQCEMELMQCEMKNAWTMMHLGN